MFEIFMSTGPRGTGKSLLFELIRKFLADDPRKIINVDTSKCLETSRKYNTPTGLKLKEMMDDQKSGKVLDGPTVVDSVMEYLDWIKTVNPFHILLSGSPRSPEEVRAWNAMVSNGLVSYRVLHIVGTNAEIHQGVQDRIAKGELRPDQTAKALATAKREYGTKTLPALKLIPSRLLAETARSKHLLFRLKDAVGHMNLPPHVLKRWMGKLKDTRHPIHSEIRKIEGSLHPKGFDPVILDHPESFDPFAKTLADRRANQLREFMPNRA